MKVSDRAAQYFGDIYEEEEEDTGCIDMASDSEQGTVSQAFSVHHP